MRGGDPTGDALQDPTRMVKAEHRRVTTTCSRVAVWPASGPSCLFSSGGSLGSPPRFVCVCIVSLTAEGRVALGINTQQGSVTAPVTASLSPSML